jgi:aspartyl-tRNA synthetase
LVINGVEVGGGSTRIHDVELQKYVFESVLKIQNHQELFGHLLRAFECGCPPHAGLAIGFDRMVAMLCGVTIRDVIAFPKTITGTDPVIGSPSKVTEKQLKAYHFA